MTDEKLALEAIEAVCEHECLKHLNTNDLESHKNCFPCKIYKIAHSANVDCRSNHSNHSEWWPDTQELHKELS